MVSTDPISFSLKNEDISPFMVVSDTPFWTFGDTSLGL